MTEPGLNISPDCPPRDEAHWPREPRAANPHYTHARIPSSNLLSANTMQSSEAFHAHDEQFQAILGSTPSLELLLEKGYPFAHEAGIYIAATRELFITSNKCTNADGTPDIKITRVNLSNNPVTADEITPDIPMGNGGVNRGADALICGQGTLDRPSGLYSMSVEAPYSSRLVIGDFLGRPFNSVNDVVVHSDGSIWFTDPTYGFEQGYRPDPALPSQVYRFKPGNGSIRAVADGFGHPNGICFSPDEKTVYITDTDKQNGDGTIDHRKASAMYDLLCFCVADGWANLVRNTSSYAFDVSVYHGEPFLTNRRLFAATDAGIPDGIKCDLDGNVYSGCGDGIHVWSPGGVLLGRVRIDGGCANFCFGKDGEIFALNEHRLWRVQLGAHVKGALLGI
ncbi:hypothetical protein N7541_006518 [Penicillium brevicompactum]|uniref:SMP-30/Gluconolactonase/LRE-like region domain-containing protein n=1 Tax=Penicillium brevicompactum TaxID=5074 RepID=A0A9W9R789_PENBR|nr:hypothetical protein N7541_006518 [Penicillium brevicompactum]